MSSTVRQGSDGSASWCEILFDSGERVFISIEVWPAAPLKSRGSYSVDLSLSKLFGN